GQRGDESRAPGEKIGFDPRRGKMKKISVLMAVGLLCTGCAKDRKPEDYCREKLNQQLAEIEAVAGTDEGRLTANQVGAPAQGDLTIKIESEVVAGDMKTCPGSQVQPFVKGSMSLVNTSTKFISFSGGAFNGSGRTLGAELVYQEGGLGEVTV